MDGRVANFLYCLYCPPSASGWCCNTVVFQLLLRESKKCFLNNLISPFTLDYVVKIKFKSVSAVSTNLSDAATSSQGAAGLAEVIVVPAGQRGACAPDTVEVVQAVVVGELSERWKTAEKGREKNGLVI